MVACETMKRFLIPMFALVATAVLAQTPATEPPPNQTPRPAMAETPNTDIYYRLAVDAIPQDGVPQGEIKGRSPCPAKPIPARSIPTGSTCPRNTTRPCPPA